MGNWERDENFLLALFHHSFIGFAYNWYMHLDREDLKSWRSMIPAFLKEFAYSKIELTHKSRQAALWVQPPMKDQEVCRYFLKSLKDPCYDLMDVVLFKDFSQLATVGEDIDLQTKKGYESPFIRAHSNTGEGGEVNGIRGFHQRNS
ncbi:uncharacterized protein G2W53_041178 [Senna tora]|uniref:Retrotransposon gag domain-containing protein n=1 Tax=Senna tora TaxID=362788 RepID=A0A834SJI6_9FABA|nr:uncharacterized protein G2W53_041178 [Senna tora]